jgi:hypothetical protein
MFDNQEPSSPQLPSREICVLPFAYTEVLLQGETKQLRLYEDRFIQLFDYAMEQHGGVIAMDYWQKLASYKRFLFAKPKPTIASMDSEFLSPSVSYPEHAYPKFDNKLRIYRPFARKLPMIFHPISNCTYHDGSWTGFFLGDGGKTPSIYYVFF